MPPRYTVPQFIDVEDKIMGPLTVRQFVILLIMAFIMFIEYKAFDFTAFLLVAILTFMVGGTLAFFKVNGQPFHFFLLNLLQTFRKPQLRVWDKAYTTGELKAILTAPPPKATKKRVIKKAVAGTKMSELSMIVNTGGVYNPED